MLSSELRILEWDEAAHWCETWRRTGKRIGFTNGCFDLLHVGHAALFDFALDHCDRLIVAINSDASVRKLKGRNRPVNMAYDRAALVGSLTAVDATVIFNEDTPLKLITLLEPDVLIKGGDYKMSDIVGADFVKSKGGKVLRCPFVEGKSTTGLLKVVR
jgi:D-beta-D-heptose 7-phosphate kinase/D-beta-D-heptose 1-phosphate adenosyltransferase